MLHYGPLSSQFAVNKEVEATSPTDADITHERRSMLWEADWEKTREGQASQHQIIMLSPLEARKTSKIIL